MRNLIFILLFSCVTTFNIFNEYEILLKYNVTYGKCGLNYDEIEFLSNKFNIDKKFIRSSVYFKNNDNNSYAINDKTFNYSFFGDNTKIIENEVKLFAKSYIYKGSKKYLIYKIE